MGAERPVGFDGDYLSSHQRTPWGSAFGRAREVDGNYLSDHQNSLLWEKASGRAREINSNYLSSRTTEELSGSKRPVGFDGDYLSSNRRTSWGSAFGRAREVDGNHLSDHRINLWGLRPVGIER